MATVTVRFIPGAVAAMTSWSGSVGRAFYRLALDVENGQTGLVARRTGALARSIRVGERQRYPRGLQIEVGGHTAYAAANELGARPHRITPKRPGGMLVFFWPRVGHVVHLRSVNHPGNRGYHWAERGMHVGLARWGARP